MVKVSYIHEGVPVESHRKLGEYYKLLDAHDVHELNVNLNLHILYCSETELFVF